MSAPALAVRGIAKRFGTVRALDGVDLDVAPGELLAVLGPTGAGKTTLLRAIAGLEQLDAGSIALDGRDATALAPAERDVALVFQNFSLYPSRSVRANLEFPLRAPRRRLDPAQIRERVEWAARLLHIERLLDRPSHRLSGGEMQRVAIGRAIVRRPRLFLMDEPLSNLDAKLREELRVELRQLVRELGTPTVWVTHDQSEALSMADRLLVLAQGRVLQVGPPEDVYLRPASPEVARQLGSPPMNVLDARLDGGWWVAADETRIVEANAAAGPDGTRARLGIRAEHIATEGGASEGVVQVVEDLGASQLLLARWAGADVHVLAPRGRGFHPSQRVPLRADAQRTVVWPPEAASHR